MGWDSESLSASVLGLAVQWMWSCGDRGPAATTQLGPACWGSGPCGRLAWAEVPGRVVESGCTGVLPELPERVGAPPSQALAAPVQRAVRPPPARTVDVSQRSVSAWGLKQGPPSPHLPCGVWELRFAQPELGWLLEQLPGGTTCVWA